MPPFHDEKIEISEDEIPAFLPPFLESTRGSSEDLKTVLNNLTDGYDKRIRPNFDSKKSSLRNVLHLNLFKYFD